MKASIEKSDHSYKQIEMGKPECGVDFCDNCGDCLHCYGDYCEPCRWVIYDDNPKNPLTNITK